MSVFYDKFERHAHGEGLKGQSTHYCAGCGHGLAHKYLADAIEELDIQDSTVLVSPVGCSVFAYYYFNTGNTQAAHGRAAAVALGHKMANPEATVISYQGDGDLASIGLAETVAAAQLGAPITVIFINNAIYGMTGGQMAPTTLMGQTTATSPNGRNRFNGEPLKMAELVAGLDGPVYVERVALFSPADRKKAARAIKKAVQLQKEGRGYSFIEVLAECPTHLKLMPDQAEKWVKENMVPIFPLGVKKDTTVEPWFKLPTPNFEAEPFLHAVGASTEAQSRFCKAFPTHLNPVDISMKLAGSSHRGNLISSIQLQETDLEKFNAHLEEKYQSMKVEARSESYLTEDAEVLLVACNTPARAAKGAVKNLRDLGIKAGLFRPITIWPFPSKQLQALLPKIKHLVVVEANAGGQILDELRLNMSQVGVEKLPPITHVRRFGGMLPQQTEIVDHVKSILAK